jgi:hypothetical protein
LYRVQVLPKNNQYPTESRSSKGNSYNSVKKIKGSFLNDTVSSSIINYKSSEYTTKNNEILLKPGSITNSKTNNSVTRSKEAITNRNEEYSESKLGYLEKANGKKLSHSLSGYKRNYTSKYSQRSNSQTSEPELVADKIERKRINCKNKYDVIIKHNQHFSI